MLSTFAKTYRASSKNEESQDLDLYTFALGIEIVEKKYSNLVFDT
jgi:hypothetical protein